MYQAITQIVPPLERENRLATHLNSETAGHGFSYPVSRFKLKPPQLGTGCRHANN